MKKPRQDDPWRGFFESVVCGMARVDQASITIGFSRFSTMC